MTPWPLRDRTSIVGIGETEYTKAGRATRTEFELACEAVRLAVEDAGLVALRRRRSQHLLGRAQRTDVVGTDARYR